MLSTKVPITYEELREGMNVVRNNTISKSYPDGTFDIFLHNNLIATLYFNGSVKVYSGGHRTATTKQRLNLLLKHLDSFVFQSRGEWFIRRDYLDVNPFKDGEIVNHK